MLSSCLVRLLLKHWDIARVILAEHPSILSTVFVFISFVDHVVMLADRPACLQRLLLRISLLVTWRVSAIVIEIGLGMVGKVLAACHVVHRD